MRTQWPLGTLRIELRQVTKRFGRVRVLDRVSFTIEPGQIVALLGPNGAGKTSLLRLLSGILVPDSGGILYDGHEFTRERLDLRRRFHFLPDFPFAHAHMTVLAHIAMCLQLYGVDPSRVEESVVETLRDLDLMALAELPFGTLSRGQAYKAALATLVLIDPEVWFLDEPFASGMDPQGLRTFRRQVMAAAERGRTILYSTQLLEVAQGLCHRFAVVSNGSVQLFDRQALYRSSGGDVETALEEIFRDLRDVPEA